MRRNYERFYLILLQYHYSDENTHITIIVSDDTILYLYIKYNMEHLMTHLEETPIAIILLISILNPANRTYHYYGDTFIFNKKCVR